MKSITLTLCALMVVVGSVFYYKLTTGESEILSSKKIRENIVNDTQTQDGSIDIENPEQDGVVQN